LPKVIENIRETILQTAKNILLSDGYDKLSLREVARQCNIAVGTIYNYFPSKLTLTAAIMLEDWTEQKEKMQRDCAAAVNAESGIRSVFFTLREFAEVYRDVWYMSIHSKEVRDAMLNGRSRWQMLIEQLSGVIGGMLDRFGFSFDPFLTHFIATSLLAYIMEPDFDYEQLNSIFKRILHSDAENGKNR
jgi:AcrR family transcriptional regulator